MDHSKRRRKVIKRLDFENCEVTTVRMKKKFRKRMKARTISEYEDEVIPIVQSQDSSKDSSLQEEKNEEKEEEVHNSPILFRKYSSQRRIEETPSPVLITKQKTLLTKRFKVDDEVKPSTSGFREIDKTTSPVFKIMSGLNKKTKTPEIKKQKSDKDKQSILIASDDDFSGNEYEIEDLSQDQRKEPSEECKISNFSTESTVFSQFNISSEPSQETLSSESERFALRTLNTDEDGMETMEESGSETESKEYERGGLIEKLFDVRRKKSSHRRICDHNRKVTKLREIRRRKVHVIDLWKARDQLNLKCQHADVSEDALFNSDPTDFIYVIIGRHKRNYFNKINRGTFLQITAPWQEIRLPALNGTALLSVTLIELIDSIPDITIPRTILREVSVTKYKEDEALLFDTILAPVTNILFQ